MKRITHYYLASALAFAFSFASFSSFAQTNEDWKVKVSPSLLEHTRDGQTSPFLILLSSQADVSGAGQLHSKDAKATYVYQTLQHTANLSQKGITAFLDEKQMYINEMGISLDMSKEEMEKKIIDWMRLEYYKMFDQVFKK